MQTSPTALPVVADLLRRVQKNNLSNNNEVAIPTRVGDVVLQLVVTRGPSLDKETILAWLEPVVLRSEHRVTLMTIEVAKARCVIERDLFGNDPQILLGDVRYTINDRYANLLESRFGFHVVDTDG